MNMRPELKNKDSAAIKNHFGLGLLVLIIFVQFGCTKKGEEAPVTDASAALVSRGKVIYQTNCTACHNADPRRPGSVGPEVFGSSLELLQARVLRAEYPQGYQPKKATHMMAALPHLKDELAALHQYLTRDQ